MSLDWYSVTPKWQILAPFRLPDGKLMADRVAIEKRFVQVSTGVSVTLGL
jgi:hypothetical protein